MLFVSLGSVRAGTEKERIASIAEADDVGAVFASTSARDDVFSFTVVPAVTADQGLEMTKNMME